MRYRFEEGKSVPVRGGHADKARSDDREPGGDNQIDHGFYPFDEARGGAGLVGFSGELWRFGGGSVERKARGLGALSCGHGSQSCAEKAEPSGDCDSDHVDSPFDFRSVGGCREVGIGSLA